MKANANKKTETKLQTRVLYRICDEEDEEKKT